MMSMYKDKMDKKPKLAALIIGKHGKEEDEEEGDEDDTTGKMEAAEDFHSSMKSGDPKAIAESFQAMMDCCS